ncbi:hypothetical protein QQP08_019960 [Theobroma cacao]|nr:hypothetical protein QQP08_019960 [Theobroma cacao]
MGHYRHSIAPALSLLKVSCLNRILIYVNRWMTQDTMKLQDWEIFSVTEQSRSAILSLYPNHYQHGSWLCSSIKKMLGLFHEWRMHEIQLAESVPITSYFMGVGSHHRGEYPSVLRNLSKRRHMGSNLSRSTLE